MMNNKDLLIISMILLLCLPINTFTDPKSPLPVNPDRSGEHIGERNQLDMTFEFSGEYGETITDENGTFYCVFGEVFYEPKVYQPEYWGVFPLYFFGTDVGMSVTVTNMGPRRTENLRVETECRVLKTDGSNGAQLSPPAYYDFELERNQSVTIDTSFPSVETVDAESGLDRVLVKLLHPNNGKDAKDPALIMSKEGVICPPEFTLETINLVDPLPAE